MNFRTSEVLQSYFNNSNQQLMLVEQAVIYIAWSSDKLVPGELYLSGIERGFELLDDLKAVQGIKGNEDAGIYRLSIWHSTNRVYEDGVALFIGTEKGLTNLFLANPKVVLSDSDREDLEDGDDEI